MGGRSERSIGVPKTCSLPPRTRLEASSVECYRVHKSHHTNFDCDNTKLSRIDHMCRPWIEVIGKVIDVAHLSRFLWDWEFMSNFHHGRP